MDPETQFQKIEEDGKWTRDDVAHIDTWRVLEDFYFQGKFRAIGISNFNERQIRDLFRQSIVKPMNHQVLDTCLFLKGLRKRFRSRSTSCARKTSW